MERDRDRQQTKGWRRETDRQTLTEKDKDIHREKETLGSCPSPHPPHLTSRTFFSVTSTWMTMG